MSGWCGPVGDLLPRCCGARSGASLRNPASHLHAPLVGTFLEVGPSKLPGPSTGQHVPQALEFVAAPYAQTLTRPQPGEPLERCPVCELRWQNIQVELR